MQEWALDLGGQARAEAETIQTDPSRRGQLSERAEAGVTFLIEVGRRAHCDGSGSGCEVRVCRQVRKIGINQPMDTVGIGARCHYRWKTVGLAG